MASALSTRSLKSFPPKYHVVRQRPHIFHPLMHKRDTHRCSRTPQNPS